MTRTSGYPLAAALTDRNAQVYYGHLLADVERITGEAATRIESLAITWLTGECISQGGRSHVFEVEDLCHDKVQLGAWKATLRIFTDERKEIEPFRKSLLASEGLSVASLAEPLFQDDDRENFNAFCVGQMAMMCTRNRETKKTLTIKDSEGHLVRITIQKKSLDLKWPAFSPVPIWHRNRFLTALKSSTKIGI